MKKFIFALTALLTITLSANAMSYERARRQALFLTDKMAYELNLTEEQYEAAYEINLDYLLGVDDRRDVFGIYWRQRNLDLSYILYDWQYQAYCEAAYFYRPLYWDSGYWRFRIYARYPHRDYFYYGQPHFYAVYSGGHSWRTNGGSSWYRRNYSRPHVVVKNYYGMRDGFHKGDYRNGFDRNSNRGFGRSNNRDYEKRNNWNYEKRNDRGFGSSRSFDRSSQNNGNRGFGRSHFNERSRESSTRSTVTRSENNRGFGGSRSNDNSNRWSSTPNRDRDMRYSTPSGGSRSFGNSSSGSSRSFESRPSGGSRSFGNSSSGSSRSFESRSSGGSRSFGNSPSGSSRSFESRSSGGSRSFGSNAPSSRSGNSGTFGGQR